MRFTYLLFVLFYVLSPIDVIPDVIAGLGWIDDLIVLFLFFKYFFIFNRKNKFYSKNRYNIKPESSFFVLGIESYSNSDVIKRVYRRLASMYHPDKVMYKGGVYSNIAEEHFHRIKRAYDELRKIGKV